MVIFYPTSTLPYALTTKQLSWRNDLGPAISDLTLRLKPRDSRLAAGNQIVDHAIGRVKSPRRDGLLFVCKLLN